MSASLPREMKILNFSFFRVGIEPTIVASQLTLSNLNLGKQKKANYFKYKTLLRGNQIKTMICTDSRS